MRNILKSLFVLSLSILLFACSSPKSEKVIDLDQLPEYPITLEKYNTEEIISHTAWDFHCIGGNFFIFNGRPNTAAYVVRATEDCQELGEFMPRGQAQGECRTPRYAGCSQGEDTIYMYDTFKFNVSVFALPKQETDTLNYTFVRETRSSQEELHGPTRRLDNGMYVAFRLSGTRHIFSLLDERVDTVCTFGSLPLPVEDDEIKNFMPFQGVMVSEGNTIYYICKMLAYMCAYQINDDKTVTPLFQRTYIPPVYEYGNSIRWDDNNRHGFQDIKINGDYIWATYSGLTYKEIREHSGRLRVHTLIVFDKAGIPLGKFVYPHEGYKFCFSKDGKYLYLFTDDCNIERIRVKDLLDKLS